VGGNAEQRISTQFYSELLKSNAKTNKVLHEVFGEHSLSCTGVSEWHSHFNASQVLAEGDKCSGHPSTSKMTENAETIQELIHED
jgi:hypothetical protein